MSGARSALCWVNMLKSNGHSFRDSLLATQEESQTRHLSPIG
jgi:hypothetical protein